LFQDLKKSHEVIKAVIDNTDLPVSIKLRSAAGNVDCLKFLDRMSDLNISAVMIHVRSLTQGFSGPIDTEIIKKARNYFGGVILANGGVGPTPSPSLSQERGAKNYVDWLLKESNADGVGIGQGALGKPWIFEEVKSRKLKVKSVKEIFEIALRHAKLMEKCKGKQGILEMRKHLCWYTQGLPGARKLREDLVKVNTLKEIKNILQIKKTR
ncbi:MAG: tRNA-dihydrouridine synthase, partial [Patescibacteria group bacterium]|nr:tRNA-dihydrouridine synthase [Patescibacteria group bacterium]